MGCEHHRLKNYGRVGNNESFDWFKSYADLAELLHTLIPSKSSRILMLGCGNSTLSEDVRLKSIIDLRINI